MASLTQISIAARRTIRYAIYAIILLIILRFTFKTGVGIYRRFFPPSPPKPTVLFGKLPNIPFPEKTQPENLSYTLETPEGTLPKFPVQVLVYSMIPSQPNIQALDAAKKIAQQLGFNPEGRVILENVPHVYLFQMEKFPSTLTMNIVTGVFSVSYDIGSDPSVISGIPPAPEEAIEHVKSYLNTAGLLKNDLKEGPTTFEFLRVEGQKFTSAISLSEADAIKINIFRKKLGDDKDGLPSVTAEMPEANVWFILSGVRRQVIAGEYHYYPIEETKNSTYPIKTSDKAWEELKEGKSFIVNVGDNPGGNITIRRIYLAYFDPNRDPQYYQPVVIFEGDNGFLAYVPAITDEYYGQD